MDGTLPYILESLNELKAEIRNLRRQPHPRKVAAREDPDVPQISDRMRTTVRHYIEQYKEDAGIEDDVDLYLGHDDKLYDYLESQEDVREICQTAPALRKIMTTLLQPF